MTTKTLSSPIKSVNKKIIGIYKIINRTNGKYYVGSSNDILGVGGRWKEHINDLNSNRHVNSYLQRAWNKYGSSMFDFVIVEELPSVSSQKEIFEIEQKHLNEAELDGRKKCYNLSFFAQGGAMRGKHHTEEAKKKIGNAIRGRVESLETRQRKSDSLKGRVGGFVGKTQTDEWRKKNSERMKLWWSMKRNKSVEPESTA